MPMLTLGNQVHWLQSQVIGSAGRNLPVLEMFLGSWGLEQQLDGHPPKERSAAAFVDVCQPCLS